jgi:hypothetical protein
MRCTCGTVGRMLLSGSRRGARLFTRLSGPTLSSMSEDSSGSTVATTCYTVLFWSIAISSKLMCTSCTVKCSKKEKFYCKASGNLGLPYKWLPSITIGVGHVQN